MYAKAAFEGEMDVGDIRIGESLSLCIFNDFPTEFIIRSIQRIPMPESSEVKSFIELYHRTESMQASDKGIRLQTLKECVDRLNTSIADRLGIYGLVLDPSASKVSSEPTYLYLPSNVGGTSAVIALCSFN
jgi:hypothetical protein